MKTALITGATSGIGSALAESLAGQGWRILVHGRDPNKTAQSQNRCGSDAESFVADLSLLSETRRLASEVQASHQRLDALVLNAGAIARKREITSEGLEAMFVINHLSAFVLASELHPLIPEGGHLLSVSTEAHRWIKRIDPENLQAEKRFKVLKHYAATKAANLISMLELANRYSGRGLHITAHHPGEVATRFGLDGPLWLRLFWKLSSRRFISSEQAAEPLAKFLTDPSSNPQSGYFNRGTKAHPADYISDPEQKNSVIAITERALGSHR